MKINIPDVAWPNFWDDYGDAIEFWGFRFKPKANPGDEIFFYYQKQLVATATILRIGRPGEDVCGHSGNFRSSWKVYWEPETFQDQRNKGLVKAKNAIHAK